MSAQLPPTPGVPDFDELSRELEAFAWRAEVVVEQIPSPQRIAPHSVAVQADVVADGEELGNGRLVLLHDPAGNEAWQGTHRFVTFARAEVDLAMVTDPLLAEVGWSWLTDALHDRGAEYVAASGTVTAVSSRCFGGMQDEPDRAEVEIRASWTPLLDRGPGPDRGPGRGGGPGIAAHLLAWQDLLCTTAGLPALPPGITALAGRQGRTR